MTSPIDVHGMLTRLSGAPLLMMPEAIPALIARVRAMMVVEVDDSPHEVVLYDRDKNPPPPLPESRVPRLPRIDNAVAVIRVQGVLGQRRGGDDWADTFTEDISLQLLEADANLSIGAVVMDFNTPGGIAYGLPEAAEVMRQVRQSTPIYSLADPMSASAGLFLSSQASKAFATPSGLVGSHGVRMTHIDISEMLAKAGVKVTSIATSDAKTEGSMFEPLSDPARAEMERVVTHHMGIFTEALALGRNVTKQHVLDNFGQGRMIEATGPKNAKDRGMIDGVATLGELLAGIIKPRESRGRARSLASAIAIEAELGA